jgi:tetratricopeptide (TPR) repeat protein
MLVAVAACGGPASPTVPAGTPIVLISVDTLRSDRLPAYGYDAIETPHLDGLAADSILFERAYCPYPLTLPSHATMFTGLLPPDHGVRDNRGFRLPDEQVTLAERLRDAGYRTGGVVSSMVMRGQTGIGQGFEVWRDDMRGSESRAEDGLFAQRIGDGSVAGAIEWLAGIGDDEPFFLFLHLIDPHTPYNAPEPYRSRYADPYDAEVAFSDDLVGRLLDDLRRRGWYDRALIVFTSDHGEGLGDHVEQEHGLLLYRETLQVPLIVKLPGQARGGERAGAPVGLVDLMPTLLSALGMEHEGLDGVPLLSGVEIESDRPLYAETSFGLRQYGWSEMRSVIEGDLHFIEAPRPELFDIVADPEERRDLLAERSAPGSMVDYLAAIGSGAESTADVSPEELERLASLGYVAGSASKTDGERPDPKNHVADAVALWEAIRAIGTGEGLAAEQRALELMRRLGVRNETWRRLIATNMLTAGRVGAAAAVLAEVADSRQPATLVLAGQVEATAGRLNEARLKFEQALEADPDYAEAHSGMGILLMTVGRFPEARPWLERAVERDPNLSEAWNGLGAVASQTGDWEAATRHWQRAVTLDPDLADAWFNLALALEKAGNPAAAAEARQRYEKLSKTR